MSEIWSDSPNFTYDALGYNGRLGNQLWQIAWQIGQAEATGGTFSVPPDWPYRPFFSLPEEAYEPHTDQENIDGGQYWYQELYHWEHCLEKVWSYFQPSEYARTRLETYAKPYVYTTEMLVEPYCSVHFRRGDYLRTPGGFPIPSMDYYRRAVEMVQSDEEVNHFLVFTDGYEWVQRAISTDHSILSDLYSSDLMQIVRGESTPVDPEARTGEPSDVLDLFLMALSEEHVIANSSFSWWGAFLSMSRRAYYPSKWWGQDMKRILDSRGVPITTSYKEAMSPNWIEVPCG